MAGWRDPIPPGHGEPASRIREARCLCDRLMAHAYPICIIADPCEALRCACGRTWKKAPDAR